MATGYAFSSLSGTGNVFQSATPTALTDGATITWAIGSNGNASATVTIAGNRTLNLTGMLAGGYYTLELFQDATGGRTLALGTGCTWKVSGGGGGAITPTGTPNALDILSFFYDGAGHCYANFVKNFS
jgi:hypothetical protein